MKWPEELRKMRRNRNEKAHYFDRKVSDTTDCNNNSSKKALFLLLSTTTPFSDEDFIDALVYLIIIDDFLKSFR